MGPIKDFKQALKPRWWTTRSLKPKLHHLQQHTSARQAIQPDLTALHGPGVCKAKKHAPDVVTHSNNTVGSIAVQITCRRGGLGLLLRFVVGVGIMLLMLLLLMLLLPHLLLVCIAQLPAMRIGVLDCGSGAILGSDYHQPTLQANPNT